MFDLALDVSKVCNCHTCCSPKGVLLGMLDLALDVSKVCNCHAFCSPRGVLLEVFDVALDASKVCNCHTFRSPRGVLSEVVDRSLRCSKMNCCHTFCFPRGVLLEVLDLALDAPTYATVTHLALPEGCCWRLLIWTWVFQSVQLSRISLSQTGAVGGCWFWFGCSEVGNCQAACSPDLDLDAPNCATVT